MSDDQREGRLALMLEATRDFAFKQMAEGERLVPFAACVGPEGEIKFFRFAEPDTAMPLEDVFALTQVRLADAARDGVLLAATTAVAVQDPDLEDGFETALRMHVEEPGYSRVVLAPFRVDEGGGDGARGQLVLGELVPIDADPVVFAD